ncbi:MAG: glycosyltransferase, partial [Spirochaetaceae bacterium]|nr:glycosyltransferase [Spirochaetaceae bacterium]
MVVPCYDEEDALPETAKRLHEKLKELASYSTVSAESRIVFVDDGSSDGTWPLIQGLHENSPDVFCG